MEDNLIELLESFEYPVIRQGSMGPEEKYPTTFFTFWNASEEGHSFYDNDVASVDWTFQVNVYSTEPELVYSLLDEARRLLKSAGYTITQRGYDVPSDEISHIGRGMVVMFLQNEVEI